MFYIKFGAVSLGDVESLLKEGRMIPQLLYRVVAHAAAAAPADDEKRVLPGRGLRSHLVIQHSEARPLAGVGAAD